MSARTIADLVTQESIVFEAPYGKFHVIRMDAIDHASMRARQLREVLILMSDADKPHLMLRLAKQLGGGVADRTKAAIEDHLNSEGLSAASLFASELSEFLR